MKVSELNNIIEGILSEEVKKAILNESKGKSKEVFHIICDGEPYMNCDTQNEAEEHLDKLKKEHPGKQFIIEKSMYESHEDMLDKLDEMGEQLEEKENTNMDMNEMLNTDENPYEDMDQVAEELREKAQKLFEKNKIDDQELHEIENIIDNSIEEYWDFSRNGSDVHRMFVHIVKDVAPHLVKKKKETTMENQEPMEGNAFGQAVLNAKEKGEKTFEFDGEQHDVEECWKQLEEEEMVGTMEEEEECKECGQPMEEKDEKGVDFEDMLRGRKRRNYFGQKEYIDGDNGFIDDEDDDTEWKHDHPKDKTDYDPEDMDEEKTTCEKCGKEMCECGGGMYESKKKTIRLSETELTNLIAKMVSESIPGLETTKKSHTESGKENSSHLKDVDKKMKDYLSFDGNDNPEFPKPIGKGEKVARKNTEKQEDEIKKNFAGLENLDYDIEPDENFKKRLKMAIEGDRLMGNAPTTEKTNVIPSNGSKLGEEPKDKDGNSIPTPETAKKIEKQVKDRGEDKKNRVLYKKEKVPVSESKTTLNSVLLEEINKMKKISEYNKKTQ
jgi:hypothetical protein